MTNEYDPTRTYCVQDEAPTNPIIASENMFILISDVRDEGYDEETKQQKWSYIRTGVMSVTEYTPIIKAEAITESYENTIELIEELRPEA